MKPVRLPKRSTKSRHPQFQRAAILERLEDRAMLATIAAGNEFLVNSAIYGNQQLSSTSTSVAVSATGDFLVTYDGFGAGDRDGVFARRFDASGAPLGESQLANLTIGGQQHDAAAALAANGDYVVVWSGRGPGDSSGIFARRFSASGNSGEIRVNVTTHGDQVSAAIAMAADGSFVVVWAGRGVGDSEGVFLRRFSAGGTPLSVEMRVNTTTALVQQTPSIGMADNGDFVVTWASQLQDGSGWGVFAQRFNSQGAAQGSEFRVNTTTIGDQFQAQVAVAPDGRFVVAWTGADENGSGIFAQRYNASGGAVGSEFKVNTTSAGDQFDPQVAINARGDFAVSWTSVGQDGSGYGIVAQNFSAEGLRDGNEYIVNGLVTGHQQNSSLGADDLGNLVVVWSGMGEQDGSGVQARRFVPDRDVLPPVITAALANDTGRFNSDRITRDPTINANINDQSFIRRLQAGLDGKALVDVTIPADFRGPIVLDRARLEQINGGALPDGDHTLSLRATDEEGNVSSGFEFKFTLDTIAPLAPTMLDLLPVDDTGSSNTDNITSKLRPRIQVAAVSGQLVELFVDGALAASAIAPVSGFTQLASNYDVGDGVHVYTAKATDVAGNESPISSESLSVTTDTTPPAAPSAAPDLVASSDSGISQTDNLTNDNTPTFAVATAAGQRVRLLVDGAIILAEGVATGSTIELTPDATTTISDGQHQITAVIVDDAGNISAQSAPLTVTIDTAAPGAPSIDLVATSDTGNDNNDNVTRDTTPTFRVSTETGNIVRLTVDGSTLVAEANTGNVNFADITTAALTEGEHVFAAVAIDPAGNAGTPTNTSQQLRITVDSIRIDLATPSDTGVGNADNLTSQNLATLQVTAPPLSMVSITIDGNAAGTQQADVTGVAVFTTPLLSDGVHIVRATALDDEGINRIGRGAMALTIDSAAPTVVTPIDDVTVLQDAANTNIPLSGLFNDLDGMQTVVRFNTSRGIFDVQLYDGIASGASSDHVANFLNYVNDYASSIFHRVIISPRPFVAQGGQIKTDGSVIPTDPPVVNEFLLSHSPGTLSLARTSVVNSGTSQFFFNLTDTSDNLNHQNQGFTVFGQVLGNGLSILTGFPEIPSATNPPASPPVVNSVTVLPQGTGRLLTYSVMGNSNSSLVTATIENNNVVLDYQPGQTGTANITIRAFDLAGNFVDDTFTVTVNPGGALMSAAASGSATIDPAILQSLPTAELTPDMAAVVAEAVRRWTSAGLDAASVEKLANVSVRVADLPTGYLGVALADTVWLDVDADGQGWFVDPTAGDDLEFAFDVVREQLVASDLDVGGRVDLLTVAAHELGHALGLDHGEAHDGELMTDYLQAGVRQLPDAALVDALLSRDW